MSSTARHRTQSSKPPSSSKDSPPKERERIATRKHKPPPPDGDQDLRVYRISLLITLLLLLSAIFLYLFYPSSERLFSSDKNRPRSVIDKPNNQKGDKNADIEDRISNYNCSELSSHARSMVTRGSDWYEPALDLLAACAIQEPKNSGVRWNMAVVLLKMGRWEEAVIWMEEAVELDPSDASYRKGLSEFYMNMLRFQEAGPHLEAYLQNKGGVEDWPGMLGEMYLMRDDEKSFLLEMFADNDDLKMTLDQLVACYIETGDFRKADQTYDILSSLWQDDQVLHLHYSTFSFGIGVAVRGAVELQRYMILEFIRQERGSLHEAYTIIGEQSLLLLTSGLNSQTISMVRALLRNHDSASELMTDACYLEAREQKGLRANELYLPLIRRVLERCLTRQSLMKALVNKGALLYISNQYGWTPLLQACSLDSTNFLNQLIASGADRNARNALQQTCLHIAVMYGSFNLVRHLNKNDFNLSSVDLFGRTAGDVACQHGWAADGFYGALNLKMTKGCLVEPAFVESKPTRLGGWLEGPTDLPPELTNDRCSIDVLETLSLESFMIDYLSIQKPVLIRNILKDRNKFKLNFQRQNFEKKYGAFRFQQKQISYGEPSGLRLNTSEVTLSEFLVEMSNQFSENNYRQIEEFPTPNYIYQAIPTDSSLLEDFKFPEMLSPEKLNIHLRDYQFYLGPALSGVPPHFHSHAWNLLVYGKKKWFFFPPNVAFYSKQHVLDWYRDNARFIAKGAGMSTCTQFPGDLLYIPDMWGHAVMNLRESVGFSQEFEHGLSEFSL